MAEQVAERGSVSGEISGELPSAAKADINSVGYFAGVQTPASLRIECFLIVLGEFGQNLR